MNLEKISENRSFKGNQYIYKHDSETTKTEMNFSIYIPDHEAGEKLPVLWFLSGLTCTEENFTHKAGAQRYANTSPRGANIAGEDDDYDFGSGAGFYLDATQAPWSKNYNMFQYITQELPEAVFSHFPADEERQGITGHSMGGHGALTIALKLPTVYKSVSAFAPIVAPSQVPWGKKALKGYLGEDSSKWLKYDAVSLINHGHKISEIFVDQGDKDNFLTEQLKPELLKKACDDAGIPLILRMQKDFDHSYFFISTFIGEHIAYHANKLKN
eukprot:maker-scaffold4502_size5824-snap-gene-0.0 protein:Tk11573 transcript:maker-scaffold4502_size5824-snap-gene-0.0-mRNA-1 annotation:"s-formylglutathione hydrolase"